MKKVTVYCGMSVQDKCGRQLHPVTEVESANALVNSDKDEVAYSNCPDFIMAVKHIGLKQGIETEFFLDGMSTGGDTELIFENFNKSFDMINELGD